MRNIFIHLYVALIAALFSFSVSASDRKWETAPGGLPYYKYEGSYSQDNDPYFLLGNSRIKVRTHVSGIYELISGERCWARFNADPARPEYGKNRATAYIDNKRVELVGVSAPTFKSGKCEVYSGAGFTRYDYDLGKGLKCSRMISIMPSDNPEEGSPLFLVTVTFTNDGTSTRRISYDEALSPSFVPSSYQMLPENERPLQYKMSTEISFRCITASFTPVAQQFVPFTVPESRSLDEFFPQSIFLYCSDAFLVVNEGELKASVGEIKLRPRKKHTFHVVIGFSGEKNKKMSEKAISKAEDNSYGAFSSMWKKHLPDFSTERRKDVRNELYRAIYSLEASAVYNDYFKDTFIPEDINHSFRTGEIISNIENINMALQACFTNPSLARSIIRYVMKQSAFDGMIPTGNKGYGYIPSDSYESGLIQIEVMNAVAEYLMRTEDYAFLDEWIQMYPIERGELKTVKSVLESYYFCLKNNKSYSPAVSASKVAYLPKFTEQLEKSGRVSTDFIKALKIYSDEAAAEVKEQNAYGNSGLTYLLEAKCLTNSQKRELSDNAEDKGFIDMRCVLGLATFDRIEASSLFRTLVSEISESERNDYDPEWLIYSYYRLQE